jgi:hypothetical protein
MDTMIAAKGSPIDRICLLLAMMGMFFVFGLIAKQLDPIVTSITGGATFHAAEISRYTMGAARSGVVKARGVAGGLAARGVSAAGRTAMARLRPNAITKGDAPRPISPPIPSRT